MTCKYLTTDGQLYYCSEVNDIVGQTLGFDCYRLGCDKYKDKQTEEFIASLPEEDRPFLERGMFERCMKAKKWIEETPGIDGMMFEEAAELYPDFSAFNHAWCELFGGI